MKISFIGFGSMAKAIAKGLLQLGQHELSAASPSLTPGIDNDGIRTHHLNKAIIHDADVIILAVKPQNMSVVLKDIGASLPANCLLISVAAGLSLSWFAQQLRDNQAIVRTMPNTGAEVGLSATPLIANAHVSDKQKQGAEQIFTSIGITTWVNDEEKMDTFTALSGSGPAYVFLLMEAMIKASTHLGLSPEIAQLFTQQTVAGALKLVQDKDLSISALRHKVTSPGGTTAAAMNILDPALSELMKKALQAAKDRATSLGLIAEKTSIHNQDPKQN